MNLRSWGNYPLIDNHVYSSPEEAEIVDILLAGQEFIPYGNGKSYGDSALNRRILHMLKNNYFLNFDPESGVLHCQAGVLLSEILDVFVGKGWFLSVTPGTKLITVGGAIAADVHGKNHHVAGSFSDHLISFRLAMPNGNIRHCSRDENNEIFKATCGGMGLTGVILDAKFTLQPINSAFIDQTMIKTGNLKETFDAFETYKEFIYSVAWIDCLAQGDALGRCLLMVGDHARDGNLTLNKKKRLSIPFNFPAFSLNKFSIRAFNTLYYSKAKSGISQQKVHFDSFFFPLDVINNWNRIYGKNGFTQYQFVLPKNSAYTGLQQCLTKIAEAGKGSFLAILKLFGKGNDNFLSFPMEGYTLALDFKIEPTLFPLLDKLDQIIVDLGGRFYLAKDCRLTKDVFERGYPQIETFRALRKAYSMDETLQSLQSRRIGI
jgi:decaprenylphospho-beta-D-ribofuranose 2-oxidase